MLKILLRRQLQETFTYLFRKRTSAGTRKRSPLLIIILAVYIVGVFGFLFYNLSAALCAPLVSVGLAWLYFCLLAIMATALGVIGGIFTLYNSLYKAKDNDLLIAMPIRPGAILLSRMIEVYGLTLLFEALVMVPAIIVYFTVVPFSALSLLLCILSLLLLPLFALTISCILAWIIAIIFSRIRTKNGSIVRTVLSLAFLAVYFYFYSKANSYIQQILANPDGVGRSMRSIMYPLYKMGLGNTGDVLSFVIYALIVLAVFAIIYIILSIGFISLSTTNLGSAKTKYKEKKFTAAKTDSALQRREFIHFKSSSVYMLNCALGTVFLIVLAVFLVIKGGTIAEVFSMFGDFLPFPLVVCAVICFVITMNDITAPSISIEGKSLWIVRSMPVSSWSILKSKLKLHLIITIPPVLLCSLSSFFATRSLPAALLTALCTCCFTVLCAGIGLFINLKMPKLDWTNEVYAVKQSSSVLISIFAGWGAVIILGVIYAFFGSAMPYWLYLIICSALFAAASAVLISWIRKKGCAILEGLSC